MNKQQLDLAERMEIGNFRKTRRLFSRARSGLNQKLLVFLEEVNPPTGTTQNRFYVPQRHG